MFVTTQSVTVQMQHADLECRWCGSGETNVSVCLDLCCSAEPTLRTNLRRNITPQGCLREQHTHMDMDGERKCHQQAPKCVGYIVKDAGSQVSLASCLCLVDNSLKVARRAMVLMCLFSVCVCVCYLSECVCFLCSGCLAPHCLRAIFCCSLLLSWTTFPVLPLRSISSVCSE